METDRADDDQQMEWETWDARTAWHLLASRHLSIMSLIEEFKLDTPMGLTRLAYKGYGFYREQVTFVLFLTSSIADRPNCCSDEVNKPQADRTG